MPVVWPAWPPPSLALVRAAQLLVAPARLLVELEPWWWAEQAAGRHFSG